MKLAVAQGFSPARRESGLTLIGLVLALVVLLGFALVVPAWVAVRVNQARVARAERDVRAIAEAIERFEHDHGFLPAWTRVPEGRPGLDADVIDLLVGPGEPPKLTRAEGWSSARLDLLSNQLVRPYLTVPPGPDPWGNRYAVNVGVAVHPSGAGTGGAPTVLVLSAGPNGIVETPYDQRSGEVHAGGDDVAVRVR